LSTRYLFDYFQDLNRTIVLKQLTDDLLLSSDRGCSVNSCSELPPVVYQSCCVVWCEQLKHLNTPDFTESKSCSVNRTVQPDVLKSCSVNWALVHTH